MNNINVAREEWRARMLTPNQAPVATQLGRIEENQGKLMAGLDASREELALLRQSNIALAEQVRLLTNTMENMLGALAANSARTTMVLNRLDQANAQVLLGDFKQGKARKHGNKNKH